MNEPPRKKMQRHNVPGTARFLTFSCYRRLRLFDNDRIKDHFAERLTTAVKQHDLSILAWVIMPEHVHVILFDQSSRVLGPFLQTLKDPFAREVIARWRKHDANILPRLRATSGSTHFWQPGGGYDRNVVGAELIEKIRYVHRNPIARKLSTDSVSWRWSSAAMYRALPEAIGPPIAFDLIPDHRDDLI